MCKVFVINLDDDLERLAYISSCLEEMSIAYERVSAFDGRGLKRNEVAKYFFNQHQITLSGKQGGGQVGCFLSHYSVWERIVNGNDDYALILEDDIHLSTEIKKFINSDEWLPNNFDIIRLEVSTNRLLLSEDNKSFYIGRSIHELHSTSWCAGAYMLSKECAKRLISFQLDKFLSTDAFLFSYEKSPLPEQLNVYQVSPALAVQDKYIGNNLGFNSNIEDFNFFVKIKKKIKKEIKDTSIKKILKKSLIGYKRVKFK